MAQLQSNSNEGGIIIFDIDEIEAEMQEDGESHQIHLIRPLSDDESAQLESLGFSHGMDGDGDYLDGEPSDDFRCWINGGAMPQAALDYLRSLRA